MALANVCRPTLTRGELKRAREAYNALGQLLAASPDLQKDGVAK